MSVYQRTEICQTQSFSKFGNTWITAHAYELLFLSNGFLKWRIFHHTFFDFCLLQRRSIQVTYTGFLSKKNGFTQGFKLSMVSKQSVNLQYIYRRFWLVPMSLGINELHPLKY